MNTHSRMHWLPPPSNLCPILERQDFLKAMRFLGVLVVASIGAQTLAGNLTVGQVLGLPAGAILAALAIVAYWDGEGRVALNRGTWWGILERAARYGGAGLVVTLGALLLGMGEGVLGEVLFSAGLNAFVIAPVSALILMARMRDSHERRFPLNGEGGELEA